MLREADGRADEDSTGKPSLVFLSFDDDDDDDDADDDPMSFLTTFLATMSEFRGSWSWSSGFTALAVTMLDTTAASNIVARILMSDWNPFAVTDC